MDHYLWDKATDEIRKCSREECFASYKNMESRRVAMDEIAVPYLGLVTVYTTFLCHMLIGPDMFESTCVLDNGEWFGLQFRYSNSRDALNCHRTIVEHLKAGKHPDTFGREES